MKTIIMTMEQYQGAKQKVVEHTPKGLGLLGAVSWLGYTNPDVLYTLFIWKHLGDWVWSVCYFAALIGFGGSFMQGGKR